MLLFGIRQMKMDQPMINLRVFKYPMFTLGTLMMFLGILIILSTAILLPLYLKGALLFSAAVAGLLLLPGNAVNVIMSPIVGSLFDKLGPRVFVITGSVIVVIGNVIFAVRYFSNNTCLANNRSIYGFILWINNGNDAITNKCAQSIAT